MNKNLIKLTIGIVLLLILSSLYYYQIDTVNAFSKNTFKYGAKGSDVEELQGRLKHLGFYYGNVDGDYGYRTLRSVKWFQSEFGLVVDGVVGAKTKLKLWEATKTWRPQTATSKSAAAGQSTNMVSNQKNFTDNEINLMANAVYGEARGESFEGQVAVAAVILNRVKSPTFPNSVSGVIFEPRAFTAVADGQIYLTPNESARRAVREAINGMDPTDGCIYYFNPDTATSAWIWSRPQYKKIGKHIFCM